MKIVFRESLGATASREEISQRLNHWLKQYVSDVESPSLSVLEKRPLRSGKVIVTGSSEHETFDIEVELQPHLKFMGNSVALTRDDRKCGECLMEISAYLSINGKVQGKIEGSCMRLNRENQIVLTDFNHSVHVPGYSQAGTSSGSIVHKPISFAKEVDKSTPKLYQALVSKELLLERNLLGIDIVRQVVKSFITLW